LLTSSPVFIIGLQFRAVVFQIPKQRLALNVLCNEYLFSMRVSDFPQMVKDYEVRTMDTDELTKRNTLLGQGKYSVIFEGDFLETDSVRSWLKQETGIEEPCFIFYGKLGYDYGYFEFFFSSENEATSLAEVLQNMFTRYPNGVMMRSEGLDNYLRE
jgi:hypothetical protein